MRLVTVLVHVSLCMSLVACTTTPDSKSTATPAPTKTVTPAPKVVAIPLANKPTPPKTVKPAAKAVVKPSSLNLEGMQGSWGLFPDTLPFVVIEGQNFRWAKEKTSYPLKVQNNALVGRVPAMKQDWADNCLVNVSLKGERLVVKPTECSKGKIEKNASIEFFKVKAHTYADFSGKSCKQLQAELDEIHQVAQQDKAHVKKLEKAGKKIDDALVKRDVERVSTIMSLLETAEKQNCNLKTHP